MSNQLFINHSFIQNDLCLKIENCFRCAVEVDEFGFYHLWFANRKCLCLEDLDKIRHFFNDDAFMVYPWDNALRVVVKYKRYE